MEIKNSNINGNSSTGDVLSFTQEWFDHLQAAVDSCPDIIQLFRAVRNDEGRIVDFIWLFNNKKAIEQNGDVIEKSLLQQNPGVVDSGIFEKMVNVTETGKTCEEELFYDYEQFDGWFHQVLIKSGDGVVMTTRDITGQKKAEQEIKNQSHFINSITEMMPDVVAVLELPSRKILYTNRNTLAWTGFDVDEIKSMSFEEGTKILHPADLPAIEDFYDRFLSLKDGEENRVECRLKNNNGEWALLSLRGQVFMRDENGKPIQALLVNQNITAQRKVEQEILWFKDEIAQRATDKYYSLFNSIDEGFAIVEVLPDQQGRITDMIYREANKAFERHSGMHNFIDKKVSELLPNLGQYGLDLLTNIYQTGEPIRTESPIVELGRWLSVDYSRIGGPGSQFIGVVFDDITERKKFEKQQEFLLGLSDILRTPFINMQDLQKAAMKLLAEHFEVMRAVYYEGESDEETFTLTAKFEREGVSIPTHLRLSDLPSTVADEYRTGRTQRVADTENETRREACWAVGLRAWLTVPFVKNGRLVTIVGLHSKIPRSWTDAEVQLLEHFAERIYAAVEKAKAKEALRQSEEKYRGLFESLDEGFCIIEVLFDEQQVAYDCLYLETNPAFLRQTGWNTAVGHTVRELTANTNETSVEDDASRYAIYGQIVQTGEAMRFEQKATARDRFYDVYAFPMNGLPTNCLAVLFNDITERKRREANLTFLAEIAEDFSRHSSVDEVIQAVGVKLGAYLQITTCNFIDVDELHDRVTVHNGWNDISVRSTVDTFQLSRYLNDEFVRASRAGETVVIRDTQNDPRTDSENYAALGIYSFVTVPFRNQRKWTHSIAVCHSQVRNWRKDEIELIEEISIRIFPCLERARTEEALHRSEEKYVSLFTASPVPVMVLDPTPPDFTIIAANEAYYVAALTTPETFIGQKLFDVFTDDPTREGQLGSEALNISLERVLATKKLDVMPRTRCDIMTPEGKFEQHWWLAINAPMLDATGQVSAIIHQVTRVTELYLAEELERENQERQTFLLKLSDALRPLADPIATQLQAMKLLLSHFGLVCAAFYHIDDDQNGVTLGASVGSDSVTWPEKLKMSDYAPDISVAYRAAKNYVVNDSETDSRLLETGRAALRTLGIRSVAGIPLVKNGKLVVVLSVHTKVPKNWCESELRLLEDVAERTWAAVERAKAENAVRRSEEQLRLFITASSNMVYKMSPDWKEMYTLNGKNILADTDDPTGVWTEKYIPEGDRELVSETVQHVVDSKSIFELEHRVFQADGSIGWVLSRAVPVLDAEGNILEWVGAGIDITARKKAEFALRESESQLRQLLKMRDEFIGVASHELMTPVTSIRAYAEIVQERLEEIRNTDDSDLLAKLNNQIERLTVLINSLLDTTKISEGQLYLNPECVDVNDLLTERIDEIKRTSKHKFELQFQDIPCVIADRERIGQVVANLLSNAIKYSPKDTTITVTSAFGSDGVVVSVQDEGYGIPQQDLQRIFDKFFRVTTNNMDTFPGMGLGLYITTQIIHKHKGTISVESVQGKGSTFSFTLPYNNNWLI